MCRHVHFIFLALFIYNIAYSQGLEDVIVEKYYASASVINSDSTLPFGAVTYRIYIDLAPEYNLQTIFGYPDNELKIETTTSFYNHKLGGVTGDQINENLINTEAIALDSWITIGSATKSHFGVPLNDDNDGSIITIKGFETTDGLMEKEAPSIMKYKMDLKPFDVNGSNIFYTNNALLGVLGGVQGSTEDNKILIAQLTTDGDLSFELNIQIGKGNCGDVELYVAKNPNPAQNKVLSNALKYGK